MSDPTAGRRPAPGRDPAYPQALPGPGPDGTAPAPRRRAGRRGWVPLAAGALVAVAGVLAPACSQPVDGSRTDSAADEVTTTASTERATTTTTAAVRRTTTTARPPTTTTTTAPPPPPTTTVPPTTAAPAPPPPPPPPPAPAPAPAPAPSCHPSYSPCVPVASDVDCQGGSGDGPAYTGTVSVIGPDSYDLDRDGDGTGCD